jgi:hypothetical protein
MFIKFSILFFVFGLINCYSFNNPNKLIFRADNYIKNIANNNECNEIYFNNIIKNEFICIYQENMNMTFSNDITLIYTDVFEDFDKVVIENMKNDVDVKKTYSNFLSAYILSEKSINRLSLIIKKYIIDYLFLFYDKLYDYIQNTIIRDEINEELILPLHSKIRYFTNNTINKYNDCLDLLQSLENSICISTNKNNIKNYFLL